MRQSQAKKLRTPSDTRSMNSGFMFECDGRVSTTAVAFSVTLRSPRRHPQNGLGLCTGRKLDPDIDAAGLRVGDEGFASAVQHAQAVDERRHVGEIGDENAPAIDAVEGFAVDVAHTLPASDELVRALLLRHPDAGHDVGQLIASTSHSTSSTPHIRIG
jgi:hypothetical protein